MQAAGPGVPRATPCLEEAALLEVRSPMVGRVVRVLVEPGAAVQAQDELLVLESMKMEIPVEAPRPGTVREVCVQVGDLVQENTVLLVLA